MKLLVVDDSAIVRKVFKKAVEASTLKIDALKEAQNGKEAIDLLRAEMMDVVFLDINMPVMNGMEFMEFIRKDPELKHLPVVIVSTEGSQERHDRLGELGIKEFLRKPVTPEELARIVASVLKG